MCDRLQIYCAELLTKAKKREILNCRCNANILKMKVLDKICQYCNTNTFKHSDEEGSPFAKMDFSIQLFSQTLVKFILTYPILQHHLILKLQNWICMILQVLHLVDFFKNSRVLILEVSFKMPKCHLVKLALLFACYWFTLTL